MKLPVLALLLLLLATPAAAHDVSYSYADLRWFPDRVELSVTMHRDDLAAVLGIASAESLMSPAILGREIDSIASIVRSGLHVEASGEPLQFMATTIEPNLERRSVTLGLVAPLRASRSSLSIDARLFPGATTFLNVYDAKGRVLAEEVLGGDRTHAEVYARGPEGIAAVLATFVRAGIHHIFTGPDHILFIVGLLLLGGTLKRVLQVATSFTAAHSVTLALAVLGIVRISGRVVEPLIALSIVYVGFENLRARPGARDWRTRVAFAFGLIHGFGFASVLREFGLPHQALAWSLLGFNLGVEAGQVCIVLAVVPLLAALRHATPRLATRAVASTSWLIIGVGSVWFVERVLRGG